MSAVPMHTAGPASSREAGGGDPPADLVLRDLSLGYGGPPVVEGVSGRFPGGSLTAIVGPNGGGKTTLLKGLLGSIPACAGTIESPHPRQTTAWLAQASEVDASFPVTVGDFVSVGLWSKIGGLRAVTPPLVRRVQEALAAVGLQDLEACWMDELSGGQFQRMRFARLLVQDAALVLLDEPFAGVDEQTTKALLQLVGAWHAQRKTVIAVLHDLDLVRAYFPQVLALDRRVLAWGDSTAALAALADAGSSA